MGAPFHYQRNRRGECSPAGKGSEQNEVLCFHRKGFAISEIRFLLIETVNTHNQASQKGTG